LTLVAFEGEYAFGYTKLSGEWIHDRFATSTAPMAASAWYLQGTHTISPRWFVAGRLEHTSSPVRGAGAYFASQPTFGATETTIGVRLTPEFTVRGAWASSRFYGTPTWTNQAGASLVWNRRWW